MYWEANGICRFLVNTCSVAPQRPALLSHKAIPQQKLQGQMLLQADSDQVTACESPRGEYFLSVHRRTSPAWVQTGYPSEMGVFFLCHALPAKISSPAWNNTCPETIMERFGFPDQHLLRWILPIGSWRLTKGGLQEAFSPELGHPLGGTHAQSNIRFSWLGFHQPVPVRVPSQSGSSHQSQVTLPPCLLTPGLCLHHGLHISPHLLPHPPTLRFPYSYSQNQIVTPLFSTRLPFCK